VVLILVRHKLVRAFSFLIADCISVGCISESDDESYCAVCIADITHLFLVKPTQNASSQPRVSRRRGAGNPIGEDGSVEAEDVVVVFFTLSAFMDQDFAPLSYQCSAIPTSGFVTRRWANLRTADGYLSLMNEEFTEVHNGVKTVTAVEDVPALLKARFGLEKN